MNMKRNLVICAGLCLVVSGCGSSSTTAVDAPAGFATLSADAAAMASNYIDPVSGDVLPTVTARTDVPTTGTASYAGYVGGELDGGDEIIGELALTAHFDSANVTGHATNFQHETDGAYLGTLNVEPATASVNYGGTVGTPDTLSATLSGDLVNGGTVHNTAILLDGQFVGGTGAELPSAVGGTADGNVGTADFVGVFIAEKP